MKLIYSLLISLFFVACGNSEKSEKTALEESQNKNEIIVTQAQFNSEHMQLGKLEQQTFNQTIKCSGMIDVPPNNKASVSTFIGGYITNTPLLIGNRVKKGQLLVTLENPEFVEMQQQYLEVAEQLSYLKSEFNRQKTLYNEKITSEKNFLKAESTYNSSLALYNGLKKKLNMLNISPDAVSQGKITSKVNLFSPIDGYVTKVNVSTGAYVSPSDIVLEIIDTDHIHLELSIFEKDILSIKKGQKIYFKIPEASAKTFEAEVHLVGTSIDETNRTVKVHAHIENESQTNFIVGMFVEAEIITAFENSLALPKEAIFESNKDYFALALKKKTNTELYFEKIKLTLDKQTENYSSVLNNNDIKNKDILIKGGYMLTLENGE
jgi:cobalt-zinc-cadmium efflux system membrane fusion protein